MRKSIIKGLFKAIYIQVFFLIGMIVLVSTMLYGGTNKKNQNDANYVLCDAIFFTPHGQIVSSMELIEPVDME